MRLRLLLLVVAALAMQGCQNFGPEKSQPRKPGGAISGPYEMPDDAAPLPGTIPEDVANVPDAVPQLEPLSRSGNPEVYEALGETYRVQKSADGFRERGYASWYGRKFHGHKTASGDKYDMFAMTAAHKTLPLPSYVRVKKVGSDKSIVVKVNDRGPFHSKRIIDLSYAAAAKLGIIDQGQAMVEIETVLPLPSVDSPVQVAMTPPATQSQMPTPLPVTLPPRTSPAPSAAAAVVPGAALSAAAAEGHFGWLQVATYVDPINAVALREDLSSAGITEVAIRSITSAAGSLHRVLVGPFSDAVASQPVREKILARGLAADWVSE